MDIKAALMEKMIEIATKKFSEDIKDPNTPIGQKFNNILNGSNGQGGLLDRIFDENDYNGVNEQNIAERENDYREQAIDAARSENSEIAADIIGRGVGTAIGGVGNIAGIYNSLLGQLMLGMSRDNAFGPALYGNPIANEMTAMGLGKKAKGAIISGAADTLNKGIHEALGVYDSHKERNRQAESLIRANKDPTSAYFDSRKQLTKPLFEPPVSSSVSINGLNP